MFAMDMFKIYQNKSSTILGEIFYWGDTNHNLGSNSQFPMPKFLLPGNVHFPRISKVFQI